MPRQPWAGGIRSTACVNFVTAARWRPRTSLPLRAALPSDFLPQIDRQGLFGIDRAACLIAVDRQACDIGGVDLGIGLDPRQRAMLDFAAKMTQASATIEEPDRQNLRDVGFSDADIWDIANVAGFFNMTNRVASATDMRPNDEYHAQAR